MEIIFYVVVTVCLFVVLNFIKKMKYQLIDMDHRLKLEESFSLKLLKLLRDNDIDFMDGGDNVG